LLHEFLLSHFGSSYSLDCLEGRRIWVDPHTIAQWRSSNNEALPIYRTVQGPGDYVVSASNPLFFHPASIRLHILQESCVFQIRRKDSSLYIFGQRESVR